MTITGDVIGPADAVRVTGLVVMGPADGEIEKPAPPVPVETLAAKFPEPVNDTLVEFPHVKVTVDGETAIDEADVVASPLAP